MIKNHFQEEETYLFSSLLDRLKGLTKENISLTTKCLLAIFWRIYGEKQFLEPLLADIENEIVGYNSDPSRESNRTKKVFACAAYEAVARKPKHEDKIQNYLSYARDSRDWLGQPRIACCLSFLEKDPIAEEARTYLRGNFGAWLSEGRHDFIAVALLALIEEISKGDLQRILENVESGIDDLPIGTISLFLTGISQSNVGLPNKDSVEDKLSQAIRDRVKTTLEDEETILAATALFLANYHRISGYFEKYSEELKETLAQKDNFTEVTKKAKTRSLLFCITLIATIGLICFMFFIPSLVEFKDNPSAFGKLLLALNTKKDYAFPTAAVLVAYILVSYLKRGDPVLGIVDYLREKVPGLFKSDKER